MRWKWLVGRNKRRAHRNHFGASCPQAFSFRRVAHRLDVVPVRVEHERGIVGGGVILADSRRPVVLAAGLERGGVELVDL